MVGDGVKGGLCLLNTTQTQTHTGTEVPQDKSESTVPMFMGSTTLRAWNQGASVNKFIKLQTKIQIFKILSHFEMKYEP
jgi:hypothetical protein